MPFGLIDLLVTLDEQSAVCQTTFTRAGAWVLAIATALPGPEAPVVELHSSYVGHPGLKTRSTHLQLGPAHQHAALLSSEHDDDRDNTHCMVLYRPRELAYDHAHRLLELLQHLGHHATVEIPDHALRALLVVAVSPWAKRQDSLSVSMMWARWVSRSTTALAMRASGKTLVHSPKGRLVVTISEPRSWRSERTWKTKLGGVVDATHVDAVMASVATGQTIRQLDTRNAVCEV